MREIRTRNIFLLSKHLPASRRFPPARKHRGIAVRMIEARVEKNVSIERGADFDSRLSIGGNSSRGINAEAHEPVTLGCNVMMCPECATLTRNHAHARTDIPMIEQGFEEHRTVEVDNGVWIGRRVIILLGVTIGDGAIVSAGAVVTKDVEPYTIVGGAPARPIEHR